MTDDRCNQTGFPDYSIVVGVRYISVFDFRLKPYIGRVRLRERLALTANPLNHRKN